MSLASQIDCVHAILNKLIISFYSHTKYRGKAMDLQGYASNCSLLFAGNVIDGAQERAMANLLCTQILYINTFSMF